MLLRIGTRASKLALAQSEWIKGKIEVRHPGFRVELIRIRTKGDKMLDSPLSKIGGKGLFVKEIEEALLQKEIDLAVHSIKDVPAVLPDGLQIPIFPEREDPRDAFVSLRYHMLDDLPEGSIVGTGSLRRAAQLLSLRPDLKIVSIRGNVDTRLEKLKTGGMDAIILAASGLSRLGLAKRIGSVLPWDQLLPAIGQGALGLEIREDDEEIFEILKFLNHYPTELTIRAERAFLKRLEGGCQVPIAGYCRLEGNLLVLNGMIGELDGSEIIRGEISGARENPDNLGRTLAEKLLESGGDRILERIYGLEGVNRG